MGLSPQHPSPTALAGQEHQMEHSNRHNYHDDEVANTSDEQIPTK